MLLGCPRHREVAVGDYLESQRQADVMPVVLLLCLLLPHLKPRHFQNSHTFELTRTKIIIFPRLGIFIAFLKPPVGFRALLHERKSLILQARGYNGNGFVCL